MFAVKGLMWELSTLSDRGSAKENTCVTIYQTRLKIAAQDARMTINHFSLRVKTL